MKMEEVRAAMVAIAAFFLPLVLAWIIVGRGDRSRNKSGHRRLPRR